MVARDSTTVVNNPPMVAFTKAHRATTGRTDVCEAGPGAYQLKVEVLSTKLKTAREGAFTTARRDADQYAPRLQTEAGPGAYDLARAMDAVKPKNPNVPFPRGPREHTPHNATFPGPRPVNFVERHAPAAIFPRGPGHDLVSVGDLATVDVPLRGAEAQRPARHKPVARFGTARRFN